MVGIIDEVVPLVVFNSGGQRKKYGMAEKLKSAIIGNQTLDLLLELRIHIHHTVSCFVIIVEDIRVFKNKVWLMPH